MTTKENLAMTRKTQAFKGFHSLLAQYEISSVGKSPLLSFNLARVANKVSRGTSIRNGRNHLEKR